MERFECCSYGIAYNGYCFIISCDTGRCITAYKLPKGFGQSRACINRKRYLDEIRRNEGFTEVENEE